MTTVQPLATFQPTPETSPDPGAQLERARSEVFGSLLRSVGVRRSEAPTEGPVTRKSRAAMLERGGGVKDLRLSDAAKLDYGSMAALELSSPGPAPVSPQGPTEPEGRAGSGRPGESSGERSATGPRAGSHESSTEGPGPAGPRAPVGQAPVAAVQPVAHAPAANTANIGNIGNIANTAMVAKAASGQVAAAGARAVPGVVPGATGPAAAARSDGVRVQPVAGAPAQARVTAQRLLGKLEGEPREPREPSPHVRQVARAMLAAVRQGQGDMSLRLLPEALGRVTVRLSLADEGVSALFQPETDSARRLLDASRDQLRAALEARGLRVERIEIDTSRVEPAGTAGPEAGLGAETGRQEGGAGGGDRAGAERTPGGRGEPVGLELDVPVPVDASWIDGVRGRVDTLA